MIKKIFFIAAFSGSVLSALTFVPHAATAQQLLDAPDLLAPAPTTTETPEAFFPPADAAPEPAKTVTITTTTSSTSTTSSTRTATPDDIDALLGNGAAPATAPAPLPPAALALPGFTSGVPVRSARPDDTPADRIAMVFYKLAGKLPEFEIWARNSDVFRNAGDFGRQEILDNEIARLRSVYTLTTLTDPVIVSKPVKLSRYNFKNRGYLIEGLDERTFFATQYQGTDYALATPKMAEYVWLAMKSDEQALEIERNIDAEKRDIILVAHLEPVYTDPENTTPLDGREYRLISAQLLDLSFYSASTGKLLWRLKADVDAADRRAQKEILDLYR